MSISNLVLNRWHNLDAERKACLGWISTYDYEKDHDNIHSKKHPGTGDWLAQTHKFQEWFNSHDSTLLWCFGARKNNGYLTLCKIVAN